MKKEQQLKVGDLVRYHRPDHPGWTPGGPLGIVVEVEVFHVLGEVSRRQQWATVYWNDSKQREFCQASFLKKQ